MLRSFKSYFQGVKRRFIKSKVHVLLMVLTAFLPITWGLAQESKVDTNTKVVTYQISDQYLQEFEVPYGYRVSGVRFWEDSVQLFLIKDGVGVQYTGAKPPMYFQLTGDVPRTLYIREAPKK